MRIDTAEIERFRSFNRFYTRLIGLLDEGLLASPYSLTEARVLYELAQSDGLRASDLAQDLGLDAGYLSRILKRFQAKGLILRTVSRSDARESLVRLSEAGRAAFAPLNDASAAAVAALLSRIDPKRRKDLLGAIDTVRKSLDDGGEVDQIVMRPHRPGDLGWITHRQGLLYHQDYGWDGTYEALVAEILAGFVRNFDPEREASWIAERDGEIVGSVFLVRKDDTVAKLRLLYVEPSTRGHGLGGRLVDACIAFARAKGYRTLTLWTNDILVAARRIYQARGCQLTAEEAHVSFGKELVGQTWDLDLTRLT